MEKLLILKELIFNTDNSACFIERERILTRLQTEMADYCLPDRYAVIFSKLLSQVSTPVYDCDYFAGRVLEALPDPDMSAPSPLLYSTGHMSFDYEKVLSVGLCGILEEIKESAQKLKDSDSMQFFHNAEIVIYAIKDYAERYSESARKKGFTQMADALMHVPYQPAYDFYSALQSIWLLHMIASCYIGSRDYAFGLFDRYMQPYYEKALRDGYSKEYLTQLLAGFFIKTNEICGRTAHDYKMKPVLSHSSKQYVNIGGEEVYEFSSVVLEAAKINNMAQPQIIVRLKPEIDRDFTENVFSALAVLTDKMNIYNYDVVVNGLVKRGVPETVAKDFTYSACCTLDLDHRNYRQEFFAPVLSVFLDVIHKKGHFSVQDILSSFTDAILPELQAYADSVQSGEKIEHTFVLDSLLISDSTKRCRYPCDGNSAYHMLNLFCPGIATIGDSLMVMDKLIFREKRFTYDDFTKILKDDFEGNESLQQEIVGYTRFGNDSDSDSYTVMAANAFLDAVDRLSLKDNFYAIPGFYSLERDTSWKKDIPASPDGRNAGEPFSENQSPTYGADKCGITSLIKSIAKLPFYGAPSGGLNLTFSGKPSPDVLKALVLSYFQLGGLHTGISVFDRNSLLDAIENPDSHKTLTVRVYGFSEYFIALSLEQQNAILNRTEYMV